MEEIVIEYDKWKNKATINGEKIDGGLKTALHHEIEWKGKTYVILNVEDGIWSHKARGIEKRKIPKHGGNKKHPQLIKRRGFLIRSEG
jgi:hypothetical protein